MANSSLSTRLAKLQAKLDTADAITEGASTRDLARVVLSYAGDTGAEAELCLIVPGLKEIFAGIAARDPEEQFRDHEERREFFREAAKAPLQTSGVPVVPLQPEPHDPNFIDPMVQEQDRARREGWTRSQHREHKR